LITEANIKISCSVISKEWLSETLFSDIYSSQGKDNVEHDD
jgi:hypothetical protein